MTDELTRTPLLAAVSSSLSFAEQTALTTYSVIHDAFVSTGRALATLFGMNTSAPVPSVALIPEPPVATTTPTIAFETPPTPPSFPSLNPSYPTYTTLVQGVSENYVTQSLVSLRNDILGTVAGMVQPVAYQGATNATTIQYVNMIQRLSDLIVVDGDFQGGTFTGGKITNAISVSATNATFTNLVADATSLGATSVTGDLFVSGTVTPSIVSAATSISSPYFIATSTMATSTFAGSLNVDNAGFVYATTTRNVGIGILSPAALLAIQNSNASQPIFTVNNAAGTEVYRITNAGFVGIGTTTPASLFAVAGDGFFGGNVIANNISATGTLSTVGFSAGSASTSQLSVTNQAWFGGTATSTFLSDGSLGVGTSSPFGGGLFTVGTTTPLLYISSNSGYIGIGTSSPYAKLSIVGDIVSTATTTALGFNATSASGYYGVGSNLTLARIGNSTYSTVQDLQNIFHSSGWVSGGSITNAGGGDVTVSAGTGLIRTANLATAQVAYFDWPAATVTAAPNDISYIGIEYNNGTPQVTVRTTQDWNYKTDFPLGRVVREGAFTDIQNDVQGVGDHAANMIQREYETMPLARDERGGGLVLSESADNARNIMLSSGTLWDRLNRYTIAATSTAYFDSYYGTTREATATSTWDNRNYDNTGVLTPVTPTKYAVLWFYVETNGSIIMMYGTDQYDTSALAETEGEPAILPDRIISDGKLVGRLVFQQDATIAVETQSSFNTPFTGVQATNHANLSNLNWSDAGHFFDTDLNLLSYDLLTSGSIFASSTSIFNSNLGVGTSSPYSRLSVWGSGAGTNRLFELTNSASTTLASVLENGTAYFKGNVGINYSTPAAKLDIVGGTTEAVLGNEMIANTVDQDFTGSSGNWVLDAGWAYGTDNVVHTAGTSGYSTLGNAFLTSAPVAGHVYQITFTTNTTAADTITPSFGGTQGIAVGQTTGTDTQVQVITAANTSSLSFWADSAWAGTIDDISVMEITPNSATQIVRNSDATIGLEIRSGGSGLGNAFVGTNAGKSNVDGLYNTSLGTDALYSNLSGSRNTAIGYGSLYNTTGDANTAVGMDTLNANTTGFYNVAIGKDALIANTIGDSNVASGYRAMYDNTTGYYNVALGRDALRTNYTGFSNVAIGEGAGYTGSDGEFQRSTLVGARTEYLGSGAVIDVTALGYRAGYKNDGWNNTFLGGYSGQNNTTGNNNIAIGFNALLPSATASNQMNIGNMIFGANLAATSTSASTIPDPTGYIGIGYSTPAARLDILGTTTEAVLGTEMITSATDRNFTGSSGNWTLGVNWSYGTNNVTHTAGVGTLSLDTGFFSAAPVVGHLYLVTFDINTTAAGSVTPSFGGTSGVAVGQLAETDTEDQVFAAASTLSGLSFLTSASWAGTIDNVSVMEITPSEATQIFRNSDESIGLEIRAGGSFLNSTFVGKNAGKSTVDGDYNTAFGEDALRSNISGAGNVANGYQALYNNVNGDYNIAVGYKALLSNTNGFYNVAIGREALTANTYGDSNVANGYQALHNSSTGYYNVALGRDALHTNTTGFSNVAIGESAGYTSADGAFVRSTLVGARAEYLASAGVIDVTALGYRAGYRNNGWDSTFLGGYAGQNSTSGNNNIAIGFNALLPSATASNQLNIGNMIFGANLAATSTSATSIPASTGTIGIGTTSPYALLSLSNSLNTTADTPLFAIASTTGGTSTSTLMTVLANGNVGIGTVNPGALFNVVAANTALNGGGTIRVDSNDSAAIDKGGQITFGGAYTGTSLTSWAAIKGAKENAVDTDYSAYLAFGTRALGGAIIEKMRITSTGDVGIGTTPSSLLDVRGTNGFPVSWFGYSGTGTAVTGNVGIGLSYVNGAFLSYSGSTAITSISNMYVGTASGLAFGDIQFNSKVNGGTATTTNMTISGFSGNVGIGTTSPYALLSISNSATTAVNTPLFAIASTTGGTSTSTLMTVLANGNVGIGTTSPASRLDIYGTLRAAQGVVVNPTSGRGLEMFYRTGGANDDYAQVQAYDRTNSVAKNIVMQPNLGNIGIGTTSPFANLSIQNLYGSANTALFTIASSTAANGSSANTFLTVTNTGNVGIGNAAPTNMFDIGSTSAGGNASINATLGTDLVTQPMVTGGWTLGSDGTGAWTISGGTLAKTTSAGTLTATAVSGMTAPTAGVTYKVTIVVSAASGNTTYTFGGYRGATIISTATTITNYITAQTTDKIVFSGAAATTVTITSVSIVPLSLGNLTVNGNLTNVGTTSLSLVGIGVTGTPVASLDIQNGRLTAGFGISGLNIGADVNGVTRTDSTRKTGLMTSSPYWTSAIPTTLLVTDNNGTDNIINLGGTGNLSNAATSLRFYTASATTTVTGTERMRIDGSGNVGIGATTVGAKLHVKRADSGAPVTSGTTQTYGTLRLDGSNNNVLDFGEYGASPYGLWMQGTNSTDLSLTYPIVLNPNGGSVGIGTTSPFANLSIAGAAGGASNLFAISTSTSGFATSTAFTINKNGNVLMGLNGSRIGVGTTNTYTDSLISFPYLASGKVALRIPRTDTNDGGFKIDIPSANSFRLAWTSADYSTITGGITGGGAEMVADGVWAFVPTSTGVVPLKARYTTSGQTADMFQINNASDIVLSKFSAEGYLSVNTSVTPVGGVATFNGNVGIGTTTPWLAMSLKSTNASGQFVASYDDNNFSTMVVDATGDLKITAKGGDIRALSENLWICDNGACPTLTATSTAGNIFVENAVTFGNGFSMASTSNNAASELGLYNSSGSLIVIFDKGL
ncbi:MAG: hypothetical protein WA058_01810 [Minisyncoccia bacterium]